MCWIPSLAYLTVSAIVSGTELDSTMLSVVTAQYSEYRYWSAGREKIGEQQ